MPGTPIQMNDNRELDHTHSSMVAAQSLTPNTVTPGLVTAVDAVFAPVEGKKRPGFWDYLWKNRSGWRDLETSQNNSVFQDSLKKAVTTRTKAYTGWERDPATGKWRKADSKAAQAVNMIDTMQSSGGTGGRMNPMSATTMNTIKDGVGAGIKSSITWQDVLADPRSSFQLWAKSNGWTGLENFSKDPTKFWGALAIGAVGIPLIVSAFVASKDNNNNNNNQSGPAINNYSGNASVPPASTSFWRQPNGDNNNGIS